MSEAIELLVDGKLYGGWMSASVNRAMNAAAGAFTLAVTDRWTPSAEVWAIEPGDLCELRVDGEVVITGFVDMVKPQFTKDGRSINVQGRDRSGDMVDCSAVHTPDQWKNIGLLKLAEILAKPFGIAVKADADLGGVFPLVKLQQGETALEAINRHAKMRKVLLMPDGKGGILLTRTGSKRAAVPLIQGQNILSASGTLDWSERFSVYVVKGQASYREETDGKAESHAVATVNDAYMMRYRPLLVVNDTETSNATAKDRAVWEANTRLGKSAQAAITVQGWRQTPGGPLWEPNLLVPVEAPWLSLSGEMLISQVTFDIDDNGGTTTTLDIMPPQAFEPEAPDGKQKKKPKRAGKGKGGGNSWSAALAEDAGG
ncbi:MAG: phage baseplate assembly protein [Steroidobacteraceae bacterium]